jgi:hypothetical protein
MANQKLMLMHFGGGSKFVNFTDSFDAYCIGFCTTHVHSKWPLSLIVTGEIITASAPETELTFSWAIRMRIYEPREPNGNTNAKREDKVLPKAHRVAQLNPAGLSLFAQLKLARRPEMQECAR